MTEREVEDSYRVKRDNEFRQRGLEQGRAEMQESAVTALMRRLGISR